MSKPAYNPTVKALLNTLLPDNPSINTEISIADSKVHGITCQKEFLPCYEYEAKRVPVDMVFQSDKFFADMTLTLSFGGRIAVEANITYSFIDPHKFKATPSFDDNQTSITSLADFIKNSKVKEDALMVEDTQNSLYIEVHDAETLDNLMKAGKHDFHHRDFQTNALANFSVEEDSAYYLGLLLDRIINNKIEHPSVSALHQPLMDHIKSASLALLARPVKKDIVAA